jgi:hypothetical protein
MSCFKEVTQIIIHPNYSPLNPNQVNDVALIKLDSDVGGTTFIGQIFDRNLSPN